MAHSCPHWTGIPTCARCRGKICTRDMTCDFCVDWSPAQWELFAKKRTYAERKRSRPSAVPKIVYLLLFTALRRQLAPLALDHIGLFFKG